MQRRKLPVAWGCFSLRETQDEDAISAFRLLRPLVAILGSQDDANAAQKVAPSDGSTAVLYTDGMIIRLMEDDENEPEPGAKRRSNLLRECYSHLVDVDLAAEHVCAVTLCSVSAEASSVVTDFETY
jgi:hypothetical protein